MSFNDLAHLTTGQAIKVGVDTGMKLQRLLFDTKIPNYEIINEAEKMRDKLKFLGVDVEQEEEKIAYMYEQMGRIEDDERRPILC